MNVKASALRPSLLRSTQRTMAPVPVAPKRAPTVRQLPARRLPATGLPAVPPPPKRLTAGLAPAAAKAELAKPLAAKPGQSLAEAARRRTALENDAKAAAPGADQALSLGKSSVNVDKKGIKQNIAASLVGGEKKGKAEGTLVDTGAFKGDGARLQLGQASASASGDVRTGKGYLDAKGKVQVELNLVKAEGVASSKIGGQEFQVKGSAQVGASAKADGSITFSAKDREARVKLGGEAFAGARASIAGSAEIFPGIKLSAVAEGQAGAGIGGSIDIGRSKGVFKVKGSLAATLGLGGKLGGGLEIDPAKAAAAARATIPAAVQARLKSAATAGTEVLNRAASAYRSGVQLSGEVRAKGEQLAQRTTGAFRDFLASSLPKQGLTTAMARSFTGASP